jgi:hypothetical protein
MKTTARCHTCGQKVISLMLEISTCRCAHIFCGNHLQAHECTFDYLKEFQEKSVSIIVAPDQLSNRV